MASKRIKGLTVQIGVDTQGLDTALKNVERSGKKAASELAEVKKAMKDNGDSAELWKQKQELLTTALESSQKKLELLEQAQKGIEQRYKDGDVDKGAYENFKKKLQEATDKLNDLKNQEESFATRLKNREIGEMAYKSFKKSVSDAEEEVKNLEIAQHSMQENVKLGNITEEQYRAFKRELINAKNEANRLETQLDDTNHSILLMGERSDNTAEDVEDLTEEVEQQAETMENSANGGYTVFGNVFANVITKGIELAGTTLKNFTADVIATGTEYESAISNVTAISGAMSEEVEMIRAKAEEMGATTKFTASESAQAMSYMAMAGWKVNDMVSGLDGIMDLSAASGEDLATVSDIVTDALTAFGLQASDSAHFADVLAAASSNANTNVALMGETFQYAAPIAGTLNYSIEDMAIATGLMANSGIKASQAGTTLNSALSRMAKPTKEMKTYMQQLGLVTMRTFDQSADPKAIEKAMRIVEDRTISAENAQIKLNQAIEKYGENSSQALTATNNLTKAQNSLEEAQEALTDLQNGETASIIDKNLLLTDENGNLKSLRETIDTLRDAFSGLSEVQQAETASAIFGKTSMAGMLAVINASTEDYNKLADAVDNADGTAKKMADTMLDNLEGDKTLFSSAFDGMKIAISKELNPALRELFKYGTEQMPKLQKSLEPFANLVVKAVSNVPKAINALEKAKPILSGILTLSTEIAVIYGAMKVKDKIKELIPAIKSLWGVIATNPLGAITAGVAVVGAAIAAGLSLRKYIIDDLEIEQTELEKLTEKHNEEIQALADKRQAINDLNDSFYENADGIQFQTDRTKDLWTELNNLTDQYGNVQQKDRARAEYILNELNNALGTEYKMTGNQIDNYRTLSTEIDNVIAKKQAEALIDSYLANSADMNKARSEARSDYEKYDAEYKEKEKALENAERHFRTFRKEYLNGLNISPEDYLNGDFKYILDEKEIEAGINIANTLISAQSELQQAKNARTQAKITFEKTSEYFEKLDNLQEAYSLGQYDRIAEIIYAEKDLTSSMLDESMSDAEQRLQAYSDSCLKTLSDFELAVKDMRQKSVDELEKQLTDNLTKGMLTGENIRDIWGNYSDYFNEFQTNGLDISPLIRSLRTTGATPADVFGDKYQDIFRNQLKNGGDMSEMIGWLNDSQYYKVSKSIFGDTSNFIDYLKKQSDTGQDISYLLEWGAKSGLATSEEFVDIYKKTVQNNLDNGFDVGNLLEWGKNAGIDLSEVFAEKFGANWQRCIDTLDADITEFIKWGEKSGVKVSDIFSDEYIDNFQNYLNSVDSNLDMNSFIAWADSNGLLMGDIFGEKFLERVNEYINYVNERENFQKFVENAGSFTKNNIINKLPFMANGGFLAHGQAVVAEAGPELLEVVNGGVRVTPLSENSRNIATNQSQNIYYNTYTINATISNDYDVSRLAEQLETERRRLEKGVGK